MLRSAASPGSVGFGRFGSGTSGLLMTPLPTGHLRSAAQKDTRKGNRCKGRPLGALVIGGARRAPLSLVAPAGRPCHWWRPLGALLIGGSLAGMSAGAT